MFSYIISIGDELLIGQVINSNAAFIAQQLNSVGISVRKVLTVGDNESDILNAFHEGYNNADVVIVTGGLGPTHDDITKKLVCKFFQTDLVLHQESLENVRQIFQRRNLEFRKEAEEQAMVPRGAIVILNKRGTAPGIFFENDNKYFIVMPGVPSEMELMMTNIVIPFFKKQSNALILHRTLNTTGIPESFLAQKLEGVLSLLHANATLAYLPSIHGVRLRISVRGNDANSCQKKIDEIESFIRSHAEKYIYSTDDETFEQVIGKIMTEKNFTLAVAESCTGGLIVHRITNVSGSSNYLERAYVTYSNESKISLLGVSDDLIKQHGAVSKEVAEAMARGARERAKTDIGLSTTGIAGPTGGTPEKPVGLVWIGYSDKNETLALKFHLGEERLRIKERASQAALELLRRKLLKKE
jgi:nicotinamide-nucleotide amidase